MSLIRKDRNLIVYLSHKQDQIIFLNLVLFVGARGTCRDTLFLSPFDKRRSFHTSLWPRLRARIPRCAPLRPSALLSRPSIPAASSR